MQRISRRQDEAGHANAGATHMMYQDEPVPVREPTIDHQCLVRHFPDSGPGTIDTINHVDGDSSCREAFAHQVGKSLMIFN